MLKKFGALKDNTDFVVLPLGFISVLLIRKIFPNQPKCIFKILFHIPCPGCGLTRALYEILSGNFYKAFYYNALSIPIFLFGIISIIWIFRDVIKEDNSYKRFFNRKVHPAIIFIFVLIMILNWMWNIKKGI